MKKGNVAENTGFVCMEVGEGIKENFEFDGLFRTPQPADTASYLQNCLMRSTKHAFLSFL